MIEGLAISCSQLFLLQWAQDLRDVEYFSMRKEVKQEHYAGVTMSEIPRLPENVTRMREDGRDKGRRAKRLVGTDQFEVHQ